MNSADKQTIYANLDKLPTLKNLIREDWLKEELEKKEPSPFILLMINDLQIIEKLEKNLNSIGEEKINTHKKHILKNIRSNQYGQVYGIITEIDVWAFLKRKSISHLYQPKVNNIPDFSIKLDKKDIMVEVTTSCYSMLLIEKLKVAMNSKNPHDKTLIPINSQLYKDADCRKKYEATFGKDRIIPGPSDSDKALSKLEDIAKNLRNYHFRNIIILNHLFAVTDPCTDPFLIYFKKAIYGFLKKNKNINLVVVYKRDIYNSTLYFHPKYPKLKNRFTKREKELLEKSFVRPIYEE